MIKQVIFDLGRVLFDWEPEKLAHQLAEEDSDFEHEVWKITQHQSWLDFDKGELRSPELVHLHKKQYPEKSLELFMNKVPHILKPIPEG